MYYKLIFEDLNKVTDDELYEQLETDEILRQRVFLDDISLFTYSLSFKKDYAIIIESDIEDKKELVEWIDSHPTTIGVNYVPCNSKGEPISIKNIKNIEDNSFLASYLRSKNINMSNVSGIGIEFDCPLCNKGDYKNTIFFDSYHIHAYAKGCNDPTHKALYKKYQQELRKLAPKQAVKEAEKELGEYSKWIKVSVSQAGNITKTIDTALLADHINNEQKFLFLKNTAISDTTRFIYKDNVYKIVSDDEIKAMIQSYIPLELRKSKDITEVMNLIYISDNYYDWNDINPERYINFKNGILDLKTKTLIEHSPLLLTTIQIPCDYNKDATSKNIWWDKYLNTLTSNDQEIIKLLNEFIGLTLSNIHGYKTKTAIFLVGKHDSGKTQIQEMLTDLIGLKNVQKLNLAQLESRFGAYDILNKRFVGSGDLPYMKIPELQMFKQLTGGDSIYVEGKGKQGFSYKYTGTLLFGMNRLPKFGGDVESKIYERMTIVQCDNSIEKKDQHISLQEDFKENYEYIIKKAIDGLYNLIDRKMKYIIPQACLYQKENYEVSNNSGVEFLNDCTKNGELQNEERIKFKTLYMTYKEWNMFSNNTSKGLKLKEFKDLLQRKELGHTKKYNGFDYLLNITLNEEGMEYLPFAERLGVQ